jgi:hypothetical protein
MKHLTGLFLLILLSGKTFAANLCDASCDLSISFPDGGSILAVKSLTITFGNGGFINNGSVVTGYSAGDVVSVAEGNTIDFQSNGSLDLGNGNIDYTAIMITSNGVMNLAATQGDSKIYISDVTLLGSAALNLDSDIEVVAGGAFHMFSGPVTTSSAIVFTNNGSVSGLFDFELATLELDNEVYDVTGSILIEADRQLEISSTETFIEAEPVTLSAVILNTSEEPTDTNDAQQGQVPANTNDSVVSATASDEGGSGMINLSYLSIIALLLLTRRLSGYDRRKGLN